jgi:hypothetical protein
MTQSSRIPVLASSQANQAESRTKTDTKKDQQNDLENELPGLESATGEAIQQLSAARQQNQQTLAAWSGVLTTVIKASPETEVELRRKIDELHEALVRLSEEKRKKAKEAEGNTKTFVEAVSGVVGEKAAQAIHALIHHAVTQDNAFSKKDPAVIAKLAAQIAGELAKSEGLAHVQISAQALEKQLLVALATEPKSTSVPDVKPMVASGATPSVKGAVSIGKDVVVAARANPDAVATYLQGKDGPALLQSRLAATKSVVERVQLIEGLKQALGAEKFSAVVQSFDQRTGAPLAHDLMRLSQTSAADQKAVIARCFGPNVTLFTKSERERFITFTKADQALTLESIKLENMRATAAIAQLERQQVESLKHLGTALKAQGLASVEPENVRTEVVRAVSQLFPGIKDASWEQARASLKDILATTNPDEFQKKLVALGVATTGASNEPATIAQREQLKELLVVVTDHMSKISEGDERLKSLRTIAQSGQLGEVEKVAAQFDAVTRGIFPEYSAERFATTCAEARVYLESLSGRISNAQGSKLEALCAERDSIEWRALQVRIQLHLKDGTAQAQRASELIQEFQLSCGTGARARGAQYRIAAQSLASSLGSVNDYIAAVAQAAQNGVAECQAEQSKLSQKSEQLKTEAEGAAKRRDGMFFNGSDYWNEKFTELGSLQAEREHGDATVSVRIQALEADIAAHLGWFDRTASAEYRQAAIEAARLKRAQELCEADLQIQEKREESIVSFIKTVATEGQSKLVASLGSAEAAIHPSLTVDGIIATLETLGVLSYDKEPLNAAFKHLSAKRVEALAAQVDLRLGVGSSFSNAAAERGSTVLLSRDLQAATRAKNGAEMVGRIHACLTTDVTAHPSSQAIDALRSVVGRDSEIGKQLAALAKSPTNQLLMEKLFARLSVEEVMRIKLFLLSYDRPELMQLVPMSDASKRPAISSPAEVWAHIGTLKVDGERPDVRIALSLLPGARALQELEAMFANVPTERLSEVLSEYQRISGVSLGQSLIAMAPPAGPIRAQYLLSVLCRSPLVQDSDLAEFFPKEVVPHGIHARTEAMRELLAGDLAEPLQMSADVSRCIKEQATERAMLLAALPVMIQMSRFDRVNEIERRLEALERSFQDTSAKSLKRYSADMIARLGEPARIEALRESVTASAQVEVLDPSGKLSREASRLVEIFDAPSSTSSTDPAQTRSARAVAVAERIRSGNYSQDETLMLEVFYAQHVSLRAGGTELRGDLRKDLEAFGGAVALGSRQMSSLLQGGGALTGYDVEQLTQGLRTGNGQLAVRAMVALQSKQALKETLKGLFEREPEIKQAWRDLTQAPAGRAVGEYYNAVVHNDTTKATIIAIGSGLQTGAQTTAELAGAAASFVGACAGTGLTEGRAFYRAMFGADIVEHASSLYHGAGDLMTGALSSDPAQRGVALVKAGLDKVHVSGFDLSLVRKGLDSVSTPEERQKLVNELEGWAKGFPNSFTYSEGKGPAIVQYMRSVGGPLGAGDALVVADLLKAPQERRLSEQQYNEYMMKREQLQFQLEQAEQLRVRRDLLVKSSDEVLANVRQIHTAATRDRDGRVSFGPTVSQAQRVVDVHSHMIGRQSDLVNQHRLALADIEASKEILRVRAVVILKTTLEGSDLGLEVSRGTHDLASLRQREATREQAIVRKSDFREWRANGELQAKALAELDARVDLIATVVKTAVVVGVSFVPGLGVVAALKIATVWNAVDKGLMVARGVPVGEALRQFVIEFAIDSAFTYLGGQALGKAVGKVGNKFGQAIKDEVKWVRAGNWRGGLGKTAEAPIFKEGHAVAVGHAPKITGRLEKAFEKVGGDVLHRAEQQLKGVLFLHEVTPMLARAEWMRIIDGRWLLPFAPLAHAAVSKVLPPHGGEKASIPVVHGGLGGLGGVAPLVVQMTAVPGEPRGRTEADSVPPLIVEVVPTQPPVVATVPQSEPLALTPQSGADVTIDANRNGSPSLLDDALSSSLFNIDALLGNFRDFILALLAGSSAPSVPQPPQDPRGPRNPPTEPPPSDRPPREPGPTYGPILEDRSSNGNAYTRAEGVQNQQQQAHSASLADQTARKMARVESVPQYRQQAVQQANSQAAALASANAEVQTQTQALALAEKRAEARALQQTLAEADVARAAERAAEVTRENLAEQARRVASQEQVLGEAKRLSAGHADVVLATDVEIIPPAQTQVRKQATKRREKGIVVEAEVLEGQLNLVDSQGAQQKIAGEGNQQKAHIASTAAGRGVAAKKIAETSQTVSIIAEIGSEELGTKSVSGGLSEAARGQSQVQGVTRSLQQQSLQNATEGEESDLQVVAASRIYAAEQNSVIEPPRMKNSTVLDGAEVVDSSSDSGDAYPEDDSWDAEMGSGSRSKRRNGRMSRERATRERAVIIQQLMTRSFEQGKREKLLRMLIALGISEKEYRELVVRIGQAEVERLASAKQAEEPIVLEPLEVAPKLEVPTMKTNATQLGRPNAGKNVNKTRAEVFAKLRKQQSEQF